MADISGMEGTWTPALGRLSESARAVLRIAAVVGEEFELAVVDDLSPLDLDQLLDVMRDAAEAGVVSELAGKPGWYVFTAEMRDALCRELSDSGRLLMQQRVVQAVESRHPSRTDKTN